MIVDYLHPQLSAYRNSYNMVLFEICTHTFHIKAEF